MTRLFWMKLRSDFFKKHEILIIESMPNGKDYVLFYLKLLCESIEHEGKLRLNDTVPYTEEMLATITFTSVDIVRGAMKVFTELGLVEIFDDRTIYMTEVQEFIGSETDSAERMRRHRAAKTPSPSQCDADVTKCDADIEIDKEIEKEIEIDQEIEQEYEERKEEKREEKNTAYARRRQEPLQSYESIMEEWEVGPQTRAALWKLIQHCALNGKKLTNAKLANIIDRLMDYYCRSEYGDKCDEKRSNEVLRAVQNGWFDVGVLRRPG